MLKFIRQLKNILIRLANLLLSFLPGSPFAAFISQMEKIPELGMLNYFLPVSEMIVIGESWLVCIGIFYLYQAVLRFAKLIE